MDNLYLSRCIRARVRDIMKKLEVNCITINFPRPEPYVKFMSLLESINEETNKLGSVFAFQQQGFGFIDNKLPNEFQTIFFNDSEFSSPYNSNEIIIGADYFFSTFPADTAIELIELIYGD